MDIGDRTKVHTPWFPGQVPQAVVRIRPGIGWRTVRQLWIHNLGFDGWMEYHFRSEIPQWWSGIPNHSNEELPSAIGGQQSLNGPKTGRVTGVLDSEFPVTITVDETR